MSSPCVSVVLPFHNEGETLGKAVASICDQTFEDWELILFDDGSTDEGRDVARRFEEEDDRVRVIRSEHVGIVEALRRGCGEARGEYIARMDGDDVAYPERLARQAAFMEARQEVAVCGARVRVTGAEVGSGLRRYEEWVNGLVSHEDMTREIFVECPLPHPTFFMRREAYNAVGGYGDVGWAEDYDLVMRFHGAGMVLGKCPEVLLDWRHSEKRLSQVDGRYSLERFRALRRHYLFESFLKNGRAFYQWGAGNVGKAWLREWEGRKPEGVVDVDPRKFGKVIHGVSVIERDELPAPGETFTVVAVGAPGAREEIREWFRERGYEESRDYLFVA